jgi:hypothetical protein
VAYKVLEVIALPVMEGDVATGKSLRKEPGEKITKEEFKKYGQDDEAIKSLIKSNALEED